MTTSEQAQIYNDKKVDFDNDEKILNDIKESLKLSTILVVDDMEFNLIMLTEILVSYGFRNIKTAQNGKEALEETINCKPDLVIIDLIMPEMDGFEYCKAIRKNPEFEMLPIVVQSSITIPQQKAKAFANGATDFVTKPIDKEELIARSLVHLERQKLFRDLKASKQRIENELNDAKKMQDVLMPTSVQLQDAEEKSNIKVRSYFESSSEIGGDFWGVRRISPTKLGIYIADFSGHGVTAALNIFRLHTLIQEYGANADDPGKYLTVLNKSLTQLLSTGQFATMFYGVIDTEKSKMHYAAAGAPDPFVINRTTNKVSQIDATGFPLGVNINSNYDTKEIDFAPGTMLFAYSDAVIETENDNGDFLQEKDIVDLIEKNWSKTSDHNVVDNIFNQFMDLFNKNYRSRLHDDLTINFYYRK